MESDKKYFANLQNGGGDFDSAFFAVGQNNWVNMENCRTLTTEAGETGTVESIGSTILVNNPNLPEGDNIQIGSALDEAKNQVVYFIWNSNGNHSIFVFDAILSIIYVALLDSQVTGGFNFNKNTVIHSARVVNNSVYWCEDQQNEPRRFNIEAALKLNNSTYSTKFLPYSSPLDISVISWIRRQPGLPPSATKITQTSPVLETNFIPEEAFLFRYRYIYRDYEVGTASSYSLLQDFNATADTFNRIDIVIPFSEIIQQDVLQVDVIALYLNGGVEFVVNSWNRKIMADAAAIAAHNAGTQALTYSFYNDKVGIALDAAYSAKPFDSFPIYCRTIEIAKNRSFTGNYIIGYDTPTQTSLAFTLTPGNSQTQLTGEWHQISFSSNCGGGEMNHYSNLYLYFANPPAGVAYYYRTPGIGVVNPIDWSVLLTVPSYNSIYDIMNAAAPGCSNVLTGDVDVGVPGVVTNAPQPGLVGAKQFKSGAAYQLAITFYDYYGRKCGLLTTNVLKAQIPDRLYGDLKSIIGIAWTLNNGNALAEIPEWAYYYSIDISKCLRTRFFVQMRAKQVSYAVKDADGNYTFTTSVYDPTLDGIGIDISSLDPYAMGYVFSEGDLVHFYIGNSVYVLSVLGQQGSFIIVQNGNVGVLDSTAKAMFEIYTPYQQQTNEPYYEVANIFPIANPRTNSRQYSLISGMINGDVFLLQRNDGGQDYLTENMSPNDKFYKLWFTDAGRPNFIDTIGQTEKTNSIAFSNTFIQGSQSNGLSTYDALDTSDIYAECGPLRKLQLTSKVEGEQGSVMLGICEEETVSLYLSESQLLASTGNADVAISNNVIGTINPLKGSFGTTDPESVYEFKGNVYWVNTSNGKVIQYTSNGLFPISSYKATRFWKLFCNQYSSMSKSDIEALGSRPFIFTCVDPHNWELLITIPKLLQNPPKGYLPDFPRQSLPYITTDLTNGANGFVGLQVYTFILPDNIAFPSNTPNYKIYFKRYGSNGTVVTFETLGEWSNYPDRSIAQIIIDGIVFYLQEKTPNAVVGVDFNVFATESTVGIYIGNQWNWTGLDNSFEPTIYLEMFIDPVFENGSIKREIIYPFDIWDGQAKTAVFKLNAQPNHWPGAYRHTPEGMVSVQDNVYGFKNGRLWQYNSISDYTINIFGALYKARIMCVGNQVPNRPKVFRNISIEGNYRPSLTYFRTEPGFAEFEQYDLSEQASDLMDFDFELKEGNLYCQLYRNKIQPTADGVNYDGLLTGEEMRAVSLLTLIEFTPVNAPIELRFITLNYQISLGHTT